MQIHAGDLRQGPGGVVHADTVCADQLRFEAHPLRQTHLRLLRQLPVLQRDCWVPAQPDLSARPLSSLCHHTDA